MNTDRALGAGVLAAVATAVATASGIHSLFTTIPEQVGLSWWQASIALTTAVWAALLVGALVYAIVEDDDPVAEIAVDGPIKRETTPSLTGTQQPDSDTLVGAIDDADENEDVEALLVTFNTPGGEITPSEDIARAVEQFDGPAVGFARDLCASGGYHIASACDHIIARENALVGSIGVKGSRPNLSELADDLGIAYEELTAGEYKEAGAPLKAMEDDERAYLQSMIDGVYEAFIETVADRRDIDEDELRATEARVYRGEDAVEIGLADAIGTRDDVESWLDEHTVGRDDVSVTVDDKTPNMSPLAARIGIGSVAYAFGAGIASRVSDLHNADLSLEYRR